MSVPRRAGSGSELIPQGSQRVAGGQRPPVFFCAMRDNRIQNPTSESRADRRRIDDASASPLFVSQEPNNSCNRSNDEHPDLASNVTLSSVVPLGPMKNSRADQRAKYAKSDESQNHVEAAESTSTGNRTFSVARARAFRFPCRFGAARPLRPASRYVVDVFLFFRLNDAGRAAHLAAISLSDCFFANVDRVEAILTNRFQWPTS